MKFKMKLGQCLFNVLLAGTFLLSLSLSPSSIAKDLVDVPIGIAPTMTSSAMFIAKEKGYFEEQGINAILNPFRLSGAQMIPFLATGQIYVGGGTINAGMYNAIQGDIPIKLVAEKGSLHPNKGHLALIVRKQHIDSGRYKTLKDLKGMTFATPAKGVSQQIIMERYLKLVGLTLSDVRLTHMGYPDMNIALTNGSIDATIQIEPFVASAVEKEIAVRISGADTVYPEQQAAAIMYSPMFIEKHPEVAKKFMVAYVKGLRDYNDAFFKNKNREEIIQVLIKSTRVKNRKIYESVVAVGLDPNGRLMMPSIRDDARWYFEQGYIKKMPDVDTVVDHSYVNYAISQLGEYK